VGLVEGKRLTRVQDPSHADGRCYHGYPGDLHGASSEKAPHVRADEVSQNVGPMLNGYAGSKYVGSGMVVWDSRAQLSSGEIDQDQFMRQVSLSAPR
jgi:hypothetical protein